MVTKMSKKTQTNNILVHVEFLVDFLHLGVLQVYRERGPLAAVLLLPLPQHRQRLVDASEASIPRLRNLQWRKE